MKRINEIKKAALEIGMDYDTENNMVITDRIRKSTFYAGYDNGYTDSKKKVLELCKKWKIKHVTILKPYTLIGEYGTVLYNGFTYDNSKVFFEHSPKKVLKVLRELYNVHKADNKFYWAETSDGLWHLYYMPTGHSTYHYGENDNDELIIMSNGQVFDVGNEHYFSIRDSVKLLHEIKKGYTYYFPNCFYSRFKEADEEDCEDEYDEYDEE